MLRSLRTRKGREETGLFLIEGVRLCRELLATNAPAAAGPKPCLPAGAAPQRGVEFVLVEECAETGGELGELAARFASGGAQLLAAPSGDFERVSDTVQSQGILAAARWNDLAPDELRFGPAGAAPARAGSAELAARPGGDRAVVLALEAVSDPGNVGTVIRTAAWFGVSAVFLGERCADLLNPKTVRATMGGIFEIPICRDVNLPVELARLKQTGFRITAAAMDGEADWRGWAESPRSALALGNEARGLTEDLLRLADQRVTIPRRGAGESLNVAVSAGILLSAAG